MSQLPRHEQAFSACGDLRQRWQAAVELASRDSAVHRRERPLQAIPPRRTVGQPAQPAAGRKDADQSMPTPTASSSSWPARERRHSKCRLARKLFFTTTWARSFREITDGTSQTIATCGSRAAAGRGLDKAGRLGSRSRAPANRASSGPTATSLPPHAATEAHILVPTDIDEKTLRALLTRAGREIVDRP